MEDLQAAAYERAIAKFARGKLIDLGCGNAPLAGIYGPIVDEYVWADWATSSDRQLFEIDFEVDLNLPLPFESAGFDTVLLSDVLEHIAEPDALFGELARITKSGGFVIIGVPFLYWIHEQPHDYHRYTRYKLEHFATKHNLTTIEIKEVGGGLDVWSDLTAKLFQLIWQPLAAVPYFMWAWARRVPLIKRLNDQANWKFPIGYIAVLQRP